MYRWLTDPEILVIIFNKTNWSTDISTHTNEKGISVEFDTQYHGSVIQKRTILWQEWSIVNMW